MTTSIENNDLTYDIEIDSNSLRCSQPIKIKKTLKPHQLACLYKAIYMENIGSITYKNNSQNRDVNLRNIPNTIKISTNIGIIGDIVGYGKTLTALSTTALFPSTSDIIIIIIIWLFLYIFNVKEGIF